MTFTEHYTDQYGRVWELGRAEYEDRYVRIMTTFMPTNITVYAIAYKKDIHNDDHVVHIEMKWDKNFISYQDRKTTYREHIYEIAQELSKSISREIPVDLIPQF